MRHLYYASIWAPHSIPADEWKFRNLKRIMFPAVDLLFILAGLSGVHYGVPAVSDFFGQDTVSLFAYSLATASFIAFVGVSFPSLWPLEILGSSILLGFLTTYLLTLLILAADGDDNRAFVLLFVAVSICPVIWRLSLLGSEWQFRRVESKGV